MIEAPSLSRLPGIRHGFFTRKGGVSSGIYASLNCGAGSSDDPAAVAANRARAAAALGAEPHRLATLFQVHSAEAVTAEAPWPGADAPRADALVTVTPGLAIGVLAADCAPVLLCDPNARVAAAVHAGWRGALAGVTDAALARMEALGGHRSDVTAAVGPCISRHAYEVGEEFEQCFLDADAANTRYFTHPDARAHFDLPGYVADRLRASGVAGVETTAKCTYAQADRFFSYRRSVHRGEADYGRQISAIVLL